MKCRRNVPDLFPAMEIILPIRRRGFLFGLQQMPLFWGMAMWGVCISGFPERQIFWLGKNDFWKLKSLDGKIVSSNLGQLVISIPELEGAGYNIRQHFLDAMTFSTFTKAGSTVKMKSYVAARENLLLVELSCDNRPFDIDVSLILDKGELFVSTNQAGQDGDVTWGIRKFIDDVDIPTGLAGAVKIIGAKGTKFTLQPGKTVTVAVGLLGNFDSNDYFNQAKQLVTSVDLEKVKKAHLNWWKEYWCKSSVNINDSLLEQHYYQSLYTMASCSGDPEFPPGIIGPWITTEKTFAAGGYWLNYNHYAPYYHLYSCNRIAQADPQDAPLLAFQDRGRWFAKNVTNTRGVLYPVGIGPKGMDINYIDEEVSLEPGKEKGGTFWGQRSNAAYSLVNMAQRWRTTYDLDYGKKIYPLVKEVTDFWEDYLKYEDGRYVIYNDAIHEGSGANKNPILSLGLLRNTFDLAIDLSKELNVDSNHRDKWEHILKHLSLWTTQQKKGKAVFRYTEQGVDWWPDNTLGIQHIYPANAIGLDSDKKWLEIARNTIDVMNRWIDINGSNSFFPAAVRVGYDPEIILDNLHRYALHTSPNGFQQDNPHGIENCSTIPNTINEMLCMSHIPVGTNPGGHLLRVFPVWPVSKDASFYNLRAWKAFLVSSELKAGKVSYVNIFSEKGKDCTILNPWQSPDIQVIENGKPVNYILSDGKISFKTTPDKMYRITQMH